MIISYKKRLFAIFLASIVLAFGFCSLSVKAFESTDDEKSDINENASWIHDYNYDHDHAVSLFSEYSTVFNEIRNWVLSDEMNSYVTKVNAIDTRWSATSANKYDGNTIFDAFDTAFSTIGIQKIQALNEDFHFNIYNKTQSVVVFTLQFGISVSPEVSESGALPKDNVKTIEWVYNGSDEYGDYRYIDDYVEYLGDGWHLTMSGYDNIDLPEPITTTATLPISTESTTTVTTTITIETDTKQTTEPPTTDAEDIATTETSTVPSTTTTGTETILPQTGYSKWYQALIAAAMGMIGVGSTAIVKSGIFRKKENNS